MKAKYSLFLSIQNFPSIPLNSKKEDIKFWMIFPLLKTVVSL